MQWDGGLSAHSALITEETPRSLESLHTFAAVELEMEGVKTWGDLSHSVSLSIVPRWAEILGNAGAGVPTRPVSSAGGAWVLTSRLSGPQWQGSVSLRQPYEARAPLSGWALPVTQLTLDVPGVWLHATRTGEGDLWALGGVSIARAELRLGLGQRRHPR